MNKKGPKKKKTRREPPSSSSSKLSLKLLIDTKRQKVLYAEANKDFVDFLFHLLSLPVATVIKLLRENSMAGCLGNLYDSIEKLSDTYMQPNQSKDSVLNPKISTCGARPPLLLANDDDVSMAKKFYMCPSYCENVADDPKAVCPECGDKMRKEVPYVARVVSNKDERAEEGGFVKGVVTYMVMDDLVVKPVSTISSITMLKKFNVKEVGALEEKGVAFNMNEHLIVLVYSKSYTPNVLEYSKFPQDHVP